MPRINNTDYRNRRAALQADWQKGSGLLAQLSDEQRNALRALYLFDTPLRSADFAAVRAEAVRRDSSLVHRAGLAYRSFAKLKAQRRERPDRGELAASPSFRASVTRRPQASGRRLTVLSDINPNLDPEQIARIIIDMAREQLLKERARDDSGSQ